MSYVWTQYHFPIETLHNNVVLNGVKNLLFAIVTRFFAIAQNDIFELAIGIRYQTARIGLRKID